MKRMNRLLMIAAFSLVVLGLPAIASAQYGNGGYYPNGNPNGNNGGYGNNGYYGDIRSTLRDLRDRAKNFERTVDRNKNSGYNNGGGWGGYGNGGYNNRDSYNDLKRVLDQFKDASKNLEKRYDGGRDLNRSSGEAQNVLNLGRQIEQMLRGFGGGYWQGEWSGIQNDLGIVANTYGYNNNGNGRNNRGNRNGGWNNGNRNGLPSWWPF